MICLDECIDADGNDWSGDEVCDDGGPGHVTNVCEYGHDCTDCGPRPPL